MPQQNNQNMQMMNDGEVRFMPDRQEDETMYSVPPDMMIGGDAWVYENPNPVAGSQPTVTGGQMMQMPFGQGNQDLSGEMVPAPGRGGMGMNNQTAGSMAQAQRMRNPVDMGATHTPENSQQAYQASLRSLLARNVGYFIVCTFLVGTQQSVTWQGILHTVGSDYIVLYQPDQERYVSCDLYALKFAQFHNVRDVPYCAASRVWEGHSHW